MSRTKTSPWRYDRAAIRLVLETEGLDAARARWPSHAVDPIARVLGLTSKYNNHNEWNIAWTPLLGTKPDSILGGEIGVSHTTVCKQRRKLGIPTCDVMAFRKARRATLAAISNEELALPLDGLQARHGFSTHELIAERRRRAVVPTKWMRRKQLDVGQMRQLAVYAIKDAYPIASLEQIGEAVGCTRERVRQILYVREAAAS